MSDRYANTIIEITGDRIAPSDVAALARQLDRFVAEERRRCAKVCRERAELWRNTALAKSGILSAREEARARANEAQYLADALELAVTRS